MPILKPEIQNALRAAGLVTDKEDSLEALMERNKLSKEDVLSTLGFLMENAGSDQTKLRAAENALKILGLLKDTPTTVPNISITIVDGKSPEGVNPILLPREIRLKETVQ
jgi:hypothetical protein